MLRMNSAFRMDVVSKRTATIMVFAVLAMATLLTAEKFDDRPKSFPAVDAYWSEIVPGRYRQLLTATYSVDYLNDYPFKWYQQAVGQFVFHQQQLGLRGIQISDWYRKEITELNSAQVPSVILAAAIANQGNSPTRPFNIDLLEKIQVLLGQTFDWPLSIGKATWDDIFKNPSVGITQIMPCESHGFPTSMLFDPKVSIKLMVAKLQETSKAALQLGISPNDWFALTLLGNNFGSTAVDGYSAYLHQYSFAPRDMKQFLDTFPASKQQLARMLAYVQYMSQYEGWALPQNIDMNYLWSLVE